MDKVPHFLWPILLIGGLGALIDFLIGRTGQERARDFLLTWWLRFDDVHRRNFGREEGLYAGELISRFCGQKMYSIRRLAVATVLLFLSLCLAYISYVLFSPKSENVCAFCERPLIIRISVAVYLVSFTMGLSFTKFIAIRTAYLCYEGQLRNLAVFSAMLLVNYLLLTIWQPITNFFKWQIAVYLSLGFAEYIQYTRLNALTLFYAVSRYTLEPMQLFQESHSIDGLALNYLSLFPYIFRFSLSFVFVGSFLLRPLIMYPVNFVWRRIVESEKPVFTLTFGGAAAFASAISEAAKHL